jgi:hypothetical protein
MFALNGVSKFYAWRTALGPLTLDVPVRVRRFGQD